MRAAIIAWAAEETRGAGGMTKSSIVLGLKARFLADALVELVEAALHGAGAGFLKRSELTQRLQRRLDDESVELHHGVALVHLRCKELQETKSALGISRDGIEPFGMFPDRIFVVALFLHPRDHAGDCIPKCAREALTNEHVVYELRTARDQDAALRALQRNTM